ncbi:MAG TPA: ABC transporter permease [Anaerolineales bacterium]|nr:ABC transporter permease [Anaerolineales bacterium]
MPKLRQVVHNVYANKYLEWFFVLPSVALLALLALPVFSLLWRAGVEGLFPFITQSNVISAMQLSLWTSALSVCIIVITGTPLAFVLAQRKFAGKNWIELIIDIPVVLPPSVAGIALLIAFGREGVFGSWLSALRISLPFTSAAVVVAQIFVSAPLFIRAARIGFSEIDPQLREAAYVEGSNEWQLFRHIILPIAARSILSGAVLAWTRALGEFGATILFAGNLQGVTQTMPIAIYVGFEESVQIAIALSFILVLVSILLLLAIRTLDNSKVWRI